MKKFIVALLWFLPVCLWATVTSQVDKSGPFLIMSSPQTIPAGFPFVAGSDLLVLDAGPTSAPYDPALVLTLGSDYTVTGGNYNSQNQMQSGSVIVVSSGSHHVAINDNIVIKRNVPINQTSSFTTQGPNTALLLEQMGDKLATLSQQVNEVTARSLQFENFEFLSGVLNKAQRSGNLLGFNSVGAPVYYAPSIITSGSVATSSIVLPGGTTTPRTLGALFNDWITVKDFGAIGNGSADDTIAIQAAITAAQVAGGGTIYIPAGRYNVTATLTISSPNVRLVGAGMWDTTLVRSTDYGDTILITGNDATATELTNVGVSDIGFLSNGLTTSGAHLNLNGVARGSFENLYFLQGFIGIKAQALTASSIRNIYLVFTNLYGGSSTGRRFMELGFNTAYGHAMCGDLFISDFNVRGTIPATNTEIGVNILAADGIWFSNGHIGNASSANLVIAATGQLLSGIYFENIMVDEGTSTGILFEGTNVAYQGSQIMFSNLQVSGGSTLNYGILFASGANFFGVQFSNSTVSGCYGTGVELDSLLLSQVSFNGVNVRDNSQIGSAGGNGYNAAAGVGGFSILGGLAGTETTGTPLQAYGIRLASGAGDNILIQSVSTKGNVTGGIQSFATGNNVHILQSFDGSTNTVASAAAIDLPLSGPLVNVTGTTSINSITALGAGVQVTLVFSGILTVNDGSNLKLAGNFTTAAGSSLSLICDGTNWIENARSSN